MPRAKTVSIPVLVNLRLGVDRTGGSLESPSAVSIPVLVNLRLGDHVDFPGLLADLKSQFLFW